MPVTFTPAQNIVGPKRRTKANVIFIYVAFSYLFFHRNVLYKINNNLFILCIYLKDLSVGSNAFQKSKSLCRVYARRRKNAKNGVRRSKYNEVDLLHMVDSLARPIAPHILSLLWTEPNQRTREKTLLLTNVWSNFAHLVWSNGEAPESDGPRPQDPCHETKSLAGHVLDDQSASHCLLGERRRRQRRYPCRIR